MSFDGEGLSLNAAGLAQRQRVPDGAAARRQYLAEFAKLVDDAVAGYSGSGHGKGAVKVDMTDAAAGEAEALRWWMWPAEALEQLKACSGDSMDSAAAEGEIELVSSVIDADRYDAKAKSPQSKPVPVPETKPEPARVLVPWPQLELKLMPEPVPVVAQPTQKQKQKQQQKQQQKRKQKQKPKHDKKGARGQPKLPQTPETLNQSACRRLEKKLRGGCGNAIRDYSMIQVRLFLLLARLLASLLALEF